MMNFSFFKGHKRPLILNQGGIKLYGPILDELKALTYDQCIELRRDGRVYRITLIEDGQPNRDGGSR